MRTEHWTDVRDAAADLLLGGTCAGCARPGRRLCERCRAALTVSPALSWPDPLPATLASPPVPPFRAGAYDGVRRELIVAYKERQRFGLSRLLGRQLAEVVQHAYDVVTLDAATLSGEVTLVPMPSTSKAVRTRGHDAVRSMTKQAARCLRARWGPQGPVLRMLPLLHHARRVADQAGLDAHSRALNLSGALVAWRRPATGLLIIVDDVLTTGASSAEAVRALRCAGHHPRAIAVIAATERLPKAVADR